MNEFLNGYGIVPNNIKLYDVAMSHSSYANEHKDKKNYERLEFLGDAVLELAMSRKLYDTIDLDEGVLTKMRAKAVCEGALDLYASKIDNLIKFNEKDEGLSEEISSIQEV